MTYTLPLAEGVVKASQYHCCYKRPECPEVRSVIAGEHEVQANYRTGTETDPYRHEVCSACQAGEEPIFVTCP